MASGTYTPPPNVFDPTTLRGQQNQPQDLNEVARQVAAQQQQRTNPTYNGAYNPMYHAAEGQPITLKDLASLYYKSQGQGLIGDNPRPYHAANVYADEIGSMNGPLESLGGFGEVIPKNAKEVRSMLRDTIANTQGGRQAVFDALVNQVNAMTNAKAQKNLDSTGIKGLQTKDNAATADAAAKAAGATGGYTPSQMDQWFQQYITPYIAQQQAYLGYTADLFDSIANDVIQSNAGTPKAEIMQAYLPLLSQAYHQKAAQFPVNFLTGNDNGSLLGQLMQGSKRNSAILNYLYGQSQTPDALGGGGANSYIAALMAGA